MLGILLLWLLRAEVGTVFALSWLITWFGHVLSDFRHVVRLYDFFLACHPLMPIYFAAVVSSGKNKKLFVDPFAQSLHSEHFDL